MTAFFRRKLHRSTSNTGRKAEVTRCRHHIPCLSKRAFTIPACSFSAIVGDSGSGKITITGADQILVVEQGKITEQGTHEQLLKKNGKYKNMFEAQMCTKAWHIR